jgi:transcriptional regulator with GAF, ATPase, and Fis domain
MAPKPGDLLLHRYRIERPLGRGGAASAFLAHDLVWDQTVALKLLHARSPELVASLRFEFDTLRSLHHPRLGRVHDLCLPDTDQALHPFFTSEFIDGVALDAFARGRPWHEVETPIADALDALALLHMAGLRHGDVKPANLLVRQGRGTLIDLGCASSLGAKPDGTVSGTSGLIAPELIEGRVADGRADLFALGKTLELILPTLAETIPPAVRSLVARMVEPKAEDRPSCADEVLEALGRPCATRHPVVRCLGRLGGRNALLQRISEVLDGLVANRPGPRVLHLAGLPGVGTSRMLRELKLQAQQRVAVVEANARRPWALASLVAFATNQPAPCATVAQAMAAWDALASRRPTVMVLDDICSMSTEDLELVCALARTVPPEHPVLLATAGAPGLLPDGPGALELKVEPLTCDELSFWVDGTLPPHTVAALHASSGGLPGRVGDVLRRLAAGTLTEVDLAQAVTSSASNEHVRRLDGVDPRIRRAAVTLSLAGQEWVTEELRSLGVSEEWVSELARLGWLVPVGAGWRALPIGSISGVVAAELEDIHLVIADWLEEKALRAEEPTQRARLRARRSEHLARAGRISDAWELLRTQEANHELALREWGQAAEEMADRANDPAAHLMAARLQRLAGHASDALRRLESLRWDETDRASWHALQHELGLVLHALGDRNRARPCLEKALDSCSDEASRPGVAADLARCLQELGANREALACADSALDGCIDAGAWASLQEVAGLALSYLGEASLARQRLQAAAERLAPLGRPRDTIRMLGNLALVAYRAGDLPGAARDYEQALALAEQHGFADQVANAALNHGTLAHQLGALGPALRSYERGLRMATALGRQSTETALCFNLAKLYVDVGLFDRATEYADRCERRARDTGAPALAAAAVSIHAEVALASGDGAAAWQHLERVRQAYERLGSEAELAQVHLHAAAIRLHEGDVESAKRHLDLARDHLRKHPEPDVAVQARGVRTRLLLSSNRPEEAADEAQRMADEAAALGMRVEEAIAHDLLARAWAAQASTALSQSHRVRARELWERVAAQLPSTLRSSFWRHPRRALVAEIDNPRPATDRPAQDALAVRVQKLERMLAINRRINSTLRTRQVLEQAMDAAIELTGAERGFLLLRADRTRRPEREADVLDVAVARNLDREQLDRSHLKFSRAIAEQVLRSGEAVLTDNAQADERFQSQRSVHAMGLRSVVCVPAMSPDGILGALYLDNRFARGRFSEQDVELLMAFADQVAIALTNARLVQELQQRNRELEQERERVQALLASQAEEIGRLSEEVRDQRAAHRYDYSRIVGESAAMRSVFSLLDRVIETSVPVLVRGESGTGKELVARAIHESGSRKAGPWVSVNCGALPEALLESELFGHVRGAFTGADRDREGLLVRGQGGTVFLDELGEMSTAMQVKLLRVLQEREVRPVGSNRVLPIDCRFVCATNRDLMKQIAEGSFREDLYYRVAVIEVVLPSLRDRAEDIPLLVSVLLERIGQRVGREPPRLTQPALRKLMEYDWPGNVRQLENVLTKAVVLCEGDRIGPGQLGLPGRTPRPEGDAHSFEQRERTRMAELLEANRWNVSKVYSQMGIPKATFYRKLKRYGLDRRA